MKKLIITFSVFTLIAINCFAQNENNEEFIDSEVIEFALNEHYSIRIRQISEREFTARKEASENLRHQNNYKVITDIREARESLENRIRGVEIEGYGTIKYLEVTHNDGVTRTHHVIWLGWNDEYYQNNFIAYFPEVSILIVEHEAGGEFPIDFNDSEKNSWSAGNPFFHNPSPNKQWRINGHSPGGAWEGDYHFLEKWNPERRRFEFVSDFWIVSPDSPASTDEEWFILSDIWSMGKNQFWVSDSKLIFQLRWQEWIFYEMEIIAK